MGMKTFKMCCFRLASWFLFYYFGGSDSSKCIVKTNCTFFLPNKTVYKSQDYQATPFCQDAFPSHSVNAWEILVSAWDWICLCKSHTHCLRLEAWDLWINTTISLIIAISYFFFSHFISYCYLVTFRNKFITLHHYLLMTSPGHFTSMK